eukprot:350729-Chlamydomonas_euryale.AAC.2
MPAAAVDQDQQRSPWHRCPVAQADGDESFSGSGMEAELCDDEQQAHEQAHAGGHRHSSSTTDGDHPKNYFASLFMTPEWMTDVPGDLGTSCWHAYAVDTKLLEGGDTKLCMHGGERCALGSRRAGTMDRMITGSRWMW